MSDNKIKTGGKFVIVGILLSIFNFAIYTLFGQLIFKDNDLLWLASMIACIVATILGYYMHSTITWKERHPSKTSIVKFFVWNLIIAILISPFLTWFYSFLSGLYEFCFNISLTIGLPFEYDFIESTLVFCLTTCTTMVINFFFYDKFIFSKGEKHEQE